MIIMTTYQVIMRTDGKHQMIVTIEDPAGTQAALAWARATYSQFLRDQDLSTPRPAEPEQQNLPTEPVPQCPLHHQPPSWVEKGRRDPFWSCHEKHEDGSWCSYTQQA